MCENRTGALRQYGFVVDVNRRPVPVTPGGYIFEWSCAVAGPEPIRARAEALYSLSTATCRAYKVPLTSFGRPKRNGVHLQRQRRNALRPLQFLQPLQTSTTNGQASRRAAFCNGCCSPAEALDSLSTATCRECTILVMYCGRPQRHGVHLQRQKRSALRPLQSLQPLQPGTAGGQASKRAAS